MELYIFIPTSLAKCRLHTCWFNSWHTRPCIETDNWVARRGTDLLVFSNGVCVLVKCTSIHLQYLCKTCDKEKMLAKDSWIIFHVWMKYSVSSKKIFFLWGLVYIMYERVKITYTSFLKTPLKFLKFNMILKFMSGVQWVCTKSEGLYFSKSKFWPFYYYSWSCQKKRKCGR
jgi:hypothetical protein